MVDHASGCAILQCQRCETALCALYKLRVFMSNCLKKYEGFDKSAAMVMNTIFATEGHEPAQTCNFDIVLGHSQDGQLAVSGQLPPFWAYTARVPVNRFGV